MPKQEVLIGNCLDTLKTLPPHAMAATTTRRVQQRFTILTGWDECMDSYNCIFCGSDCTEDRSHWLSTTVDWVYCRKCGWGFNPRRDNTAHIERYRRGEDVYRSVEEAYLGVE